MRTISGLAALSLALISSGAWGQSKEHPIPQIARDEGRYALMVDDAPFLVLGAEVNNSSGWPEVLPKVWPAIEYMHANTVEIPVYWEQFEPQPGAYDYSVVDTLLAQARQHRLHLILLWFATWKNGNRHYMPEWMKAGPADLRPCDRRRRPSGRFCFAVRTPPPLDGGYQGVRRARWRISRGRTRNAP